MKMTIEEAITQLNNRISTGCLGGDDDHDAVDILLADYARLVEAKNLQVELLKEAEEDRRDEDRGWFEGRYGSGD